MAHTTTFETEMKLQLDESWAGVVIVDADAERFEPKEIGFAVLCSSGRGTLEALRSIGLDTTCQRRRMEDVGRARETFATHRSCDTRHDVPEHGQPDVVWMYTTNWLKCP